MLTPDQKRIEQLTFEANLNWWLTTIIRIRMIFLKDILQQKGINKTISITFANIFLI
jgi:hypothetical protein